jgi:nucleotide-binding universal stress UspA family protein
MFKNILIPTDGSILALKGARAGIKLAKALGAKVTGVYVVLPYVPPMYGEAALYYVPGLSPQDYEKSSKAAARKALDAIESEARKAGVRCTTRAITSSHPHDGILKTARVAKCDAIAMATHGRSGLGGLLLGSETQRVLAHSKLPVLVTH